MVLFLFACRPSVREMADVISTIPLGISRDEVRDILIERYSQEASKEWWQSYGLFGQPRPVNDEFLRANKELIAQWTIEGRYIRIHPPNLFDTLSTNAFFDMIGIGAETARGNGSLSLYYDHNTNYVGFFADSIQKVRKGVGP